MSIFKFVIFYHNKLICLISPGHPALWLALNFCCSFSGSYGIFRPITSASAANSLCSPLFHRFWSTGLIHSIFVWSGFVNLTLSPSLSVFVLITEVQHDSSGSVLPNLEFVAFLLWVGTISRISVFVYFKNAIRLNFDSLIHVSFFTNSPKNLIK